MQLGSSLNINGTIVATYKQGPNDSNVAIVFVHGNSSSCRTFERQLPGFDECLLMGLDLPGHGQSNDAGSSSAYSLTSYAEVLRALVQPIPAKKKVLVGWSLGGHVVLEALNDVAGDCVALLIGTPPLRSVADMGNAFVPSPVLALVQQGVVSSSEADTWARNCTSLGSDYPEWLRTDFERTDPQARIGLVSSLLGGAFKNEWDQVAGASRPVTLVLGEKDPFINKGFLEDKALLRNVWGQRVELLAGAGHMAHWDTHQDFNQILAARIQDL